MRSYPIAARRGRTLLTKTYSLFETRRLFKITSLYEHDESNEMEAEVPFQQRMPVGSGFFV